MENKTTKDVHQNVLYHSSHEESSEKETLKVEPSYDKKTVERCRKFVKDDELIIKLSEELNDQVYICSIDELLADSHSSNQRRNYSDKTPTLEDVRREPSLRYFYYKPAKHFPHFDYIYTLIRKCKLRIEKSGKCKDKSEPFSKDVVIQIGIAGMFTENNLDLISKRRGKEKKPKDSQIWKASPLLCFQNESTSESAFEVLRQHNACHRILIKSDAICGDEKEVDDSIIIIGQNKAQVEESITSCLEQPLHNMLQDWLGCLKKTCSSRIASGLISEVEAIREQMVLDKSRKEAPVSVLPKICPKSIVPEEVKNYLFGRSDVNSFGIWSNSSLKVFVKKSANVKQLKAELIKIDHTFFEKYHPEIEERKLIEKRTLRQGDSVLPNLPDENGTYNAGTLGGFVRKTDDERKLYALTCNHLFLDKSEDSLAYADNSYAFGEIGTCVFTTMEKSCDFAAVEIMDSFSDNCDVTFRREDEKETNARIYTDSLRTSIVHKIGATTNVTTGRILSPEWYNDDNKNAVFLVEGLDEKFSEEGDSGSLVFSRPRSVQQNYVNVLGMVYASDPTCYNDEDEQNAEKPDYFSSQAHDVEKIEVDKVEIPKSGNSTSSHSDASTAASHIEDGENISFCFRLDTALDLFKENQGEDFNVRFKDDLSTSPCSSSSSSRDSN